MGGLQLVLIKINGIGDTEYSILCHDHKWNKTKQFSLGAVLTGGATAYSYRSTVQVRRRMARPNVGGTSSSTFPFRRVPELCQQNQTSHNVINLAALFLTPYDAKWVEWRLWRHSQLHIHFWPFTPDCK